MEKLYNVNEVSEILKLKVRTVRQWIRDGKIHAKKYDGCRMWFVSEEEIERIQRG